MPKAGLLAPTPILEAPVAMCVSVTVVQNKFYLSLLYPELGLALHEPCPGGPQRDLSGANVVCRASPPRLIGAAGSKGTSKVKPQAS